MEVIASYEPTRRALVRSKAAAIVLFAELESAGVPAEEALQRVHCRPMQEVLLTLETLRHWQQSESAYRK